MATGKRGYRTGIRKEIVSAFKAGKSYQEISVDMDLPYGHVVEHLARARRRDQSIRRQGTAGHTGEKTRRILELRAAGWTNTEIATEMECSYSTVSVTLSQARRRMPVDRFSRTFIALTEDERAELDEYAARAGVAPNRLARQIIVRALDEGLVPVILGGDPAVVLARADP